MTNSNAQQQNISDILQNEFYFTTPSVAEDFAEGERYERMKYLDEILGELDDQRIAKVDQQREYAIRRDNIKLMEKTAKAGAERAIARLTLANPELIGLGMKFSSRAYLEKSTKVNYTLVFMHILDCIVDSRAGNKTQKAILDSVKQTTNFPEISPNIWTLPLKKFMKAKLRDRLEAYKLPTSLAEQPHMAAIRKAMGTYYASMQAVHKIKVDIAITPEDIIINGTRHPICKSSVGKYQYSRIRLPMPSKRAWLNIDELKVLFGLAGA